MVASALLLTLWMAWCFLQSGHSRAEDEAKDPRLPPELVEKVKAILQKRAPEGTLTLDESHIDCVYHRQEFRTHALGGRFIRFSKQSGKRFGLSTDGFGLSLSIEDPPGPSSVTGGFYVGRASPDEYWMSYNCYYELPDDRCIEMQCAYGAQADQDILKAIRAELEAVGNEYGTAGLLDWDRRVIQLQVQLTDLVKKHQPEATWRRDERSLVCEFETMKFDIHAVDSKGHVAEDIHKEVGPQTNGFIIRLSPSDLTYRRQPAPVCGRSRGPYWNHYFCIYNEGNLSPFRLDILYGDRVDKKLLEEVITSFIKQYGNPNQF